MTIASTRLGDDGHTVGSDALVEEAVDTAVVVRTVGIVVADRGRLLQ